MKRLFKKIKILLSIYAITIATLVSGQNNWELVYEDAGEANMIKDIVFVPGSNNLWQNGWALQRITGSGKILKTADGGTNWQEIFQTICTSVWGIEFIDENTGFVCGNDGKIIKTTDGGLTWSLVYSSDNEALYKIKFKDANNGVVVGNLLSASNNINNNKDDLFGVLNGDNNKSPNSYELELYTSDGGITWIEATGGNAYWGLDYAGNDTYYAIEPFDGDIGRTTDGGASWVHHAYTSWSGVAWCIDFLDIDCGIVGGSDGQLDITKDGGSSWSNTQIDNGGGEILAVDWYDKDTLWASGVGIYKSINGGDTWSLDTNMWEGNISNREMFITGTYDIFITGHSFGLDLAQIWRKKSPLSANFTAIETVICHEDSIDFTNLSTGGVISWDWTFEGGTPSSSTDQNPTVIYNDQGTYDVELIVGDGITTSTTIKENYINVQSIPDQPEIPTGNETVCAGETSTYISVGSVDLINYSWIFTPSGAGILTENGLEATIDWNPEFSGNAFISLVGSNQCGNGLTSEILAVEVLETPMPEISGLDLVCDDQVEEYSVDFNLGSTYTWEITGGSITEGQGTNMITVTWGEPGDGIVLVSEVTSVCIASSEAFEVLIDNCTGLAFDKNDSGVSIYPNPASDFINMKLNSAAYLEFSIFNSLGQVELQKTGSRQSNNKVEQIDLSSLNKGLYIIRVKLPDNNVVIKQFVKH